MARVIPYRALAWLAIVMLCLPPGWSLQNTATAQGVVMGPPAQGQPMWINQPPMMQVGPTGAVNLDQSMAYTTAQPVMAPAPVAAQPWGAQAIAPQPAWGAPWTPTTNAASPVGYVFTHRTSVFGEFLYLRPRDAEVAYALPIDGPVLPVLGNEIPIGPVAVVDPEYDPAFKVGANIAVSDGSSIAGQYTRLKSETSSMASIAAPDVLRSLVTHPLGVGRAFDSQEAAATLDIELDLFDLDFRSLAAGCECADYAYAVNYVVGAQYATLDQQFASNFTMPGTTTVNTAVNFEGAGMRLGLQGERHFPSSGLFVYGSGITNILFGEFDASYAQNTDVIAPAQVFTSWSAGRVVPVVDLELGAGWLGANRHLKLSAGYRVSAWFNVVTTDDWIWAVQQNDFRNMDDTLTFDGLVARAEWLF